ncbi:inositol 2-dehydrogenase [Tropicibacter sp. S64]|uniref:inositol 2-dehydrogenase n=1 Tax=Tropicibacter sp. S64 TaxID=3415122 RepID=UPI003C7C313E
MTRIALLGCGRIGQMHADIIAAHPRASLAGVFDTHGPAAQAAAARHGCAVYDSPEAAFASDADAVLIATPTSTHVEFIKAGVAAGKAVLCEKPIDLDLGRARDCGAALAGSDVPVMIGFCRRFDPGHRAARAALLDGRLGDLHQVVITSRDPGMAPDGYIRTSGGIFRDMTIHDLDLARYMLGEEVIAVSATGARLVNPALMEECGDYDTVTAVLSTASGKQAIITNSRQAVYGYDQRVELFGSGGMALSDNHREHNAVVYGQGFTNHAAPLQHFFIERYHAAFVAEIDNFVDAVEGKAAPEVTFDDGVKALALAEACFKSIAEARTIQLSEV